MTKPIIQIDDEARAMTDEEYENYLALCESITKVIENDSDGVTN
jgi:hypothetical protein